MWEAETQRIINDWTKNVRLMGSDW
jgi:hypothetical protein